MCHCEFRLYICIYTVMYSDLYNCVPNRMQSASNVNTYLVYSATAPSELRHTLPHSMKYTEAVLQFIQTIFGQSWLFSQQPTVNCSKHVATNLNSVALYCTLQLVLFCGGFIAITFSDNSQLTLRAPICDKKPRDVTSSSHKLTQGDCLANTWNEM